MKKTLDYLYNFDFLRIIFTVFIVIHHILEQFHIFNRAASSVEFFFILSGFFLTYTVDNQKNCEEFVVKKFIRFWPLVCFSVVCTTFLSGNFMYERILAPLLFLPATGIYDNFTGSITIWYVCVLFWVSIFYFYLIKYFNKTTVNICIGVLTFYNYIACIRYGWGLWEPIGDIKIFTTGMARGIAGMGCGYFIATLYKNHISTPDNLKKVSLGYSILEILTLVYILISMFTLETPDNRIFIVISFILLIWLFLMKRGLISRYFDSNLCRVLSQYCLSVFLTHNIVITFFTKYISTDITNFELITFLIVSASIIFGILVHYIIEKPVSKYLKTKVYSFVKE